MNAVGSWLAKPFPTGSSCRLRFHGLLPLVACASCTSDDERSCRDDLDGLLAVANVPAEERFDCGSFASFDSRLTQGMRCLESAITAGAPAQRTVNLCIDCSIPSTFVVGASGDLVRIEIEADSFGDDLRTITVERCEAFAGDGNDVPMRVAPEQVYRCQDPLE
jgi:hypothetical protein